MSIPPPTNATSAAPSCFRTRYPIQTVSTLRVFISHHHEEKLLALSWQLLVSCLTQSVVVPWYSSDERAAGGVTPGEWHPQVRKEIEDASVILVLITPVSNEKPWLFFESGLASGQRKTIVPIYYFMRQDALNSVFRSLQCYDGDRLEGPNGVRALCGRLMQEHLGTDPADIVKQSWEPFFQQYHDTVQQERTNSYSRTLFHDHFHNFDAAAMMEDRWFAKWTEIHKDGSEDVFEVDSLFIWTSDTRLRMVGASRKVGIDTLSDKNQTAARVYPMEGVVSRAGWIAASYWSGGTIPICGTTLLAPQGSSGELLEGTWQGFTARNIHDNPVLTTGRVVIGRSEAVVTGYWPQLAGQNPKTT